MKRTWAVRVYRVALRALPRQVRDGFGAEMIDTFERLLTRARTRGRMASGVLVAGEVFDVVARGAAHRLGAFPALPTILRATSHRLLRRPAYGVAVAATLALGVGASSAMFAVVRTVVLRPLPFHEPDRLASAWQNVVGENNPTPGTTNASFLAWRQIDDLFSGVEGFARDQAVLTAPGEPEQIRIAVVTPGLFELLGIRPALGRTFRDPEGRPGDTGWAILSRELWSRRFASDPGILGRTIELDRRTVTVVGIMPSGFDFPERGTELWLPVAPVPSALTPDEGSPVVPGLDVLVRMRPGLERERANEILESRVDAITAAGGDPGVVPWLYDLAFFTTPERTRGTLVLLFGGVLLVLLIAGANVASLGLSQAVDRRGELSVRRALGAGTPRVVGELFLENSLLALLGGALGLALAESLLRGLTPLVPDQLGIRTWGQALTVWPGALPFAVAAALTVAATVTLLTLTRGFGGARAVEAAGRAGTHAPGPLRFQQLLIAGQLALAVLLLAGSTLVARSVLRLEATDTGFDADRLLAVSLRIPTGMMMSDERSPELLDAPFDEYRAALSAVPGVRSVASTTSPLPLTRARFRPAPESGEGATTSVGDFLPMNEVDGPFFETAGIAVLEGRGFDESDDSASVIIVNDELARRLWPEGGAVGRRLRVMENDPWRTVVGVVESTAQMGLRDPMGEGAEIYIPLDRTRFGVYRTFLIRAEGVAPAALGPAVRDAVWAVDPLQPIERLLPLEAAFSDSIARERFFLALIGAFALMAALLAGCGTYAILTRSLARRTRELGIRTALGARPALILVRVARTAFGPALLGIVVGITAAWPASRVLEALLYEVEPGDPVSLAITVVALVTVVTLAAIGPARRALRTDVVDALRSE